MVEEHLGDGASRGMEITYSYDGKLLLGTGGAIRRALPMLGETFWVMYADSYMDIDYRAVLSHFDARPSALGLMTVLRNNGQWDKSNVIFKDNTLIRYDKRSASPEMTYIDFGVALLRRAAADRMGGGAFDEAQARPFDLANLYTQLVEEGSMIGYEVHNRFYEIGTPQSWVEADEYLRKAHRE
jgi:NDP-sugar pyrophosphorylase family protein